MYVLQIGIPTFDEQYLYVNYYPLDNNLKSYIENIIFLDDHIQINVKDISDDDIQNLVRGIAPTFPDKQIRWSKITN